MKILFANIGWMKYYQGNQDYDPIRRGGAHPAKRKHEIFNFMPINGKYYGYVRSRGALNLQAIDQNCPDVADRLDGVLVVWVATHPKNGGRRIVGWYKNATVYRELRESKNELRKSYAYNVRAKVSDCTLIPPCYRNGDMAVPHEPGFIGQANIWYPNKYMHIPTVKKYIASVLDYIDNYNEKNEVADEQARQTDAQEKKRVEKKAVELVTKHYKSLGYTVISVEKDNIGWDLNAFNGKESLKLEVKGRGCDDIDVMITRNEYQNMKKYKRNYRLCVVTNALSAPKLSIFYWNKKLNKWVDEKNDSVVLNLEAFDYNATIKSR